jgi:hypothetical protein
MLCSIVVGYHCFGRPHCFHLPTTTLHGITTQKTSTQIFITIKTSDLTNSVLVAKYHQRKLVEDTLHVFPPVYASSDVDISLVRSTCALCQIVHEKPYNQSKALVIK